MDNASVDYYATFDNYMVGTIQGQYVVDTLDLDNAAGPFNIEFTTTQASSSTVLMMFLSLTLIQASST